MTKNPETGWLLEPDYADAWKAYSADPSPTNVDGVLRKADPIIRMGVSTYGGDSPLIRSHARRIAVESLPGYDPTRASLKTHLMSRLQGLQRHSARRDRYLSVPEQFLLDRNRLASSRDELLDDLGREPSDLELSDHARVSLKRIAAVRGYKPPTARGQLAAGAAAAGMDPDSVDPAVAVPGGEIRRAEMLHRDLDPVDQVILERTLGLHGHPRLPQKEIAAALGISPSATTQRAQRIQAKLDELADLGVM